MIFCCFEGLCCCFWTWRAEETRTLFVFVMAKGRILSRPFGFLLHRTSAVVLTAYFSHSFAESFNVQCISMLDHNQVNIQPSVDLFLQVSVLTPFYRQDGRDGEDEIIEALFHCSKRSA